WLPWSRALRHPRLVSLQAPYRKVWNAIPGRLSPYFYVAIFDLGIGQQSPWERGLNALRNKLCLPTVRPVPTNKRNQCARLLGLFQYQIPQPREKPLPWRHLYVHDLAFQSAERAERGERLLQI